MKLILKITISIFVVPAMLLSICAPSASAAIGDIDRTVPWSRMDVAKREKVAAFTQARPNGVVFKLTEPGAGEVRGEINRRYVQIWKYSGRGRLVRSFGRNGRTEKIRIGRVGENWRYQPIAMPDGRVAVFGDLGDTPELVYLGSAIVMFDSRGRLDKKFGRNGVLIRRFPYGKRANAFLPGLAVPVGRRSLALCGLTLTSDGTQATVRFLNSRGRLDKGFGNSGVIRFARAVEATDKCEEMVGGDAPIVMKYRGSKTESGGHELVRLDQRGQVDSTFGDAGTVRLPKAVDPEYGPLVFSSYDMRIDAAGRVIVAIGDHESGTFVIRALPNGRIDTAFASGGYGHLDLSTFVVVPRADGSVVLAGNRLIDTPWGDFNNLVIPAIGGLKSDGTPNTAWGATGRRSFSSLYGHLGDMVTVKGRNLFFGVSRIPKEAAYYRFPGPPLKFLVFEL